jgi:hypothetical protein
LLILRGRTFFDKSGIFIYPAKLESLDSDPTACITSKTTSEELAKEMRTLGLGMAPIKQDQMCARVDLRRSTWSRHMPPSRRSSTLFNFGHIESEINLDKCMTRLFNPSDSVVGVMTDHAILDAYRGADPDKFRSLRLLKTWQEEKYGIGLPNSSPRLCRAVSDALDEFILNSWDGAFAKTLANLKTEGHKPTSTDSSYCDESERELKNGLRK